MRMRKYSSDSPGRLGRQQEVIVAIFRKILSLNGLARLPELYTRWDPPSTDLGRRMPSLGAAGGDGLRRRCRIRRFDVCTDG
jgi:hypothetical protein